jgi:chromate reductase
MATAIGISGSLREGSYNTALLRAASELAPEGLEIEIVTLHGIPPFNADEEAEHFPKTARELKERIASADAVLISTPEYNTGIPGVAKNAFDWLSRPPKDIDRVWGDLPIALIGATPGRGGTRFSQMAWLPVIRSAVDGRHALSRRRAQRIRRIGRAAGRHDPRAPVRLPGGLRGLLLRAPPRRPFLSPADRARLPSRGSRTAPEPRVARGT